MTESLLLFTFSPIQPFILEARRTADLHTGSHILVELAKAAAQSIKEQGGELIYPSSGNDGKLPDDVPNKIVAKIKSGNGEQIARNAGAALLKKWSGVGDKPLSIAEAAKEAFSSKGPWSDGEWNKIWNRQTAEEYLWEVYWVVVDLPSDDEYKETYIKAEKVLSAVKRTRPFAQPPEGEPGLKDSLSGKRQALRSKEDEAKKYWENMRAVHPFKIRKGERLDSIGVIKRFGELHLGAPPFNGFPSTSSIASLIFLQEAEEKAGSELAVFREAVEKLFPKNLPQVRNDPLWPYDGDFLYPGTFTKDSLVKEYGEIKISDDEHELKAPLETLQKLYDKTGGKSSLYYAILAFDGDRMGERVTNCNSEQEHRNLSRALTEFAMSVPGIAKKNMGAVVYNGGDDVLAMAPLSTAFDFARELAQAFENTGNNASASCGIAIAHHTSPLSVALREARKAEAKAKMLPDKAAVCVTVLKRSGEIKEMRSRWDQENPPPRDKPILQQLIMNMSDEKDILSSRFAYEVAREANTAAALIPDARRALLARQVKRHVNRHKLKALVTAGKSLSEDEIKQEMDAWIDTLTNTLHQWSLDMDGQLPPQDNIQQGMVGLGKWLIFARFVAQGGGE